MTTGVSIPGLVARMLEGADRFSVGGTSLWKLFVLFGAPKKVALIVSALLIVVPALWMAFRRSDDDLSQMALFAVCARVFTYHNVIDNVVIAFLVYAVARTWIERDFDWRLGWPLLGLVVSLLMPGRISEVVLVQTAMQLFWVGCLILVIAFRTRRFADSKPFSGSAHLTRTGLGHSFAP